MQKDHDIYAVTGASFFVPLSSPNKRVYWECICKLYSVMEYQLSFGIDRDNAVDELQYYFDENMAYDISDDEVTGKSTRDKANWMLRKLEAYGWIEIETDKSYNQRINFRDYSVKIMRTLLDIADGRQIEYQGYIYSIYSMVRSDTDRPGVVLLQILEDTRMLISGLKNLNSGIKKYIDELTKYKTPSEIMDVLFNDYIENIIDKAYHRLLTSDNVSKFRPEIIESLEGKSHDESYVEKAAVDIGEIREVSSEEARDLVYSYIHEIVSGFSGMDEILDEINRKNARYQRAAINRAKFYLIGGEDVRGQLKDIISVMGQVINEEEMDLGGIYRMEFMDGLVRLFSSMVIDGSSLYTPVEGKKVFKPVEIEDEIPDQDLRNEKISNMMRKLERALDTVKIDDYVLDQLSDKKQIKASEMPLESIEDFVKLIYVRLYGQRKTMSYIVEKNDRVTINGYSFDDFEIKRKE